MNRRTKADFLCIQKIQQRLIQIRQSDKPMNLAGAVTHSLCQQVPKPSPFLHLIPSTISLVGVEVELAAEIAREQYLKNILSHVRDEYEFILLDCPPSLGLITLNALCAGTEILIPLQCEFFALEGIAKLIGTYQKVKKLLNPELSILGVLLTMFDGRNRIANDVKEEVRRTMPDHLMKTIIPRNVRVAEAPSYGMPVTEYDPHSSGAENYRKLAAELIAKED